jgi:hypothetical protein
MIYSEWNNGLLTADGSSSSCESESSWFWSGESCMLKLTDSGTRYTVGEESGYFTFTTTTSVEYDEGLPERSNLGMFDRGSDHEDGVFHYPSFLGDYDDSDDNRWDIRSAEDRGLSLSDPVGHGDALFWGMDEAKYMEMIKGKVKCDSDVGHGGIFSLVLVGR